MLFLKPPKILGKICTYDPLYSKRARCLSEPHMLIHYKQKQITNNLKQNAKMNNRMIQITDAKVRGFWADSKKMARFLSKLLRQDIGFATK